MSEAVQERIERAGPKRILSLDGGGIRGLITLGVLEHVEALLQQRPGRESDFRLCDHYDLIGGTSTGAIIAAGLAVGMSVSDLIRSYLSLGTKIFGQQNLLGRMSGGTVAPKFNASDVDEVLKPILGDIKLGDDRIRTGLCIVAKRFDTNSVWPIVNAPKSKYFEHKTQANKNFFLRKIVRASTAAPTYFDPEVITLGPVQYGFIDGGISMHNNPALQLLIAATAPGFGFDWKVGEGDLSILSIGTGEWPRVLPIDARGLASLPLGQVVNLVGMLMEDASAQNELLLQALGVGRNRREIDRVTGALDGKLWGTTLFRYERYQVELTEDFMKANGMARFVPNIDAYREMDNINYMADLLEMGRALAKEQVLDTDVV